MATKFKFILSFLLVLLAVASYAQATLGLIYSLGLQSRNEGWTVISNHPGLSGSGKNETGTQISLNTRTELVSPWAYTGLRVGYVNWYTNGVGENPNPFDQMVKSSFGFGTSAINETSSDMVLPFTYGGLPEGMNRQGTLILSDPNWSVYGAAGVRNYIKSSVFSSVPAGPGSAPTASAAGSSGHLPAATFYVNYAYVYPGGIWSNGSPVTSGITTSTNNVITVTSPTNPNNGSIGYVVGLTETASPTFTFYSAAGYQAYGTNTLVNFYGPYFSGGVASNTWLRIPVAGTPSTVANVGGLGGGTLPGAVNNGEYYSQMASTGLDVTLDQIAMSASGGFGNVSITNGFFGPSIVLGFCPDGPHASVAIVGDSIATYTGDFSYLGDEGGYLERAINHQLTQGSYDPTQTPLYGHVSVSTPGEKAQQFAAATGLRRTALAAFCSEAIDEYGTNDLGTGEGSAAVIGYLITIDTRFLSLGMGIDECTLLPKTNSTDTWMTVTNQTVGLGSNEVEGERRQVNNWKIDTSASNVITGDVPFRVASSAYGPTGTPYSGGDGVATTFISSFAFQEGTEAVTVNGALQALTTNYSYLLPATINGTTYASGIVFNSAPASGAVILANYTKITGWKNFWGPSAKTHFCFQGSAAVEVNGAGTPQLNGGFYMPAAASALQASKTATSFTSTTLVDTSETWAQDTWRQLGASVRIISDSTTPAAAGQMRCVQSNSATTINIAAAWTVTPDANAVYEIRLMPTQDGTHPSSWLAYQIAAAMGITSSTFTYTH